MLRTLSKISLMLLLASPLVQAEEVSTDWISPVRGETESRLGASVQSVESDESGSSTVTLSIPKPALEGAENMEEVVVVGQGPDDSEEPLEIRHEWVSDYDKDNYGLVLYLGKNGNVPLRLYFKSPH